MIVMGVGPIRKHRKDHLAKQAAAKAQAEVAAADQASKPETAKAAPSAQQDQRRKH